jgi:uncharacterized membrane protein SpoIIM required for sporulation
MNASRGLQRWVAERLSAWQALLPALQRLELGRADSAQEVLAAVDSYRSLGRDLSIARRVLPASRLTRALEQRYARLHAIIHRKPVRWGSRLQALFRDEIPEVMRELRVTLLWVGTLFVLSSLAGAWLINSFPELVSLILDESTINAVEQGEIWTESPLARAIPGSWVSVGILANNILVAVTAMCLGVFFGLGTFYITTYNGLMLGAAFAFTAQHALGDNLFKFVIAHGVVELSVIVVAAAAGAMLGESLIRPTHSTRLESFGHAAGRAARVLLLCALLLVGCGFIEGQISLHSNLSVVSRTVLGLGYGILMVLAFTGRLFGRRKAAATASDPAATLKPGAAA